MAEQKMEFCKRCKIPKELCPKVCNIKTIEVERKVLPEGTILHQDYQIYGVLGAGGMSVTYCACTRLEPVVLKQFNPTQANRKGLDMEKECKKFGGEAYKLRELKHPNIVRVENILEDEESKDVFLVMELLRGITLEEYLQKLGKPMLEQEAYKMLTPIFHALETVHQENLVHRDVKPSNIMVCDDGIMKLIDFGSARSEDNNTKTVCSTEGYAPPEQYDQHGDQGPWTDVYALCATLYRMITGKIPPLSLLRCLNDELEIPEGLKHSEELEKGLALKAKDRWQTVEELQAALGISNLTENIKYVTKKSLKKAAEVAGEKIVEGFEFDRVQGDIDKSDISWERETEWVKTTEYVDGVSENKVLQREDIKKTNKPWILTRKDVQYMLSRQKNNIFVIPNGVVEIAECAFSNFNTLKGINIPDSVTSVGYSAFSGCDGLEEVTIPDSVVQMKSSIFMCCSGLQSAHLSKNMTEIVRRMFKNCTKLQEITIPDGVTRIGDEAFEGCRNLRTIYIPDSVRSIDVNAFNGCKNLTDIYFLHTTQTIKIARNAFQGVVATLHYRFPAKSMEWLRQGYGGTFERICMQEQDRQDLPTLQGRKDKRSIWQRIKDMLY